MTRKESSWRERKGGGGKSALHKRDSALDISKQASDLQDEGRHGEDHGLVKNGVGVIPLGGGLLLAYLSPVLQEVDFDKRVCRQKKKTCA